MSDIVILGGARTAIGTFDGALAGIPPIALAATFARGDRARGHNPGLDRDHDLRQRHRSRAARHASLASGRDGCRLSRDGPRNERQPPLGLRGAGDRVGQSCSPLRTRSRDGLRPLARILGYAHAGLRREVMGTGPVPAVRALRDRTGLAAGDFDVIESSEAFAAQALAITRAFGLDPDCVNPNGAAIALGHPVGATGAILTSRRWPSSSGRRALVTVCIGGGQGVAFAIERVQ